MKNGLAVVLFCLGLLSAAAVPSGAQDWTDMTIDELIETAPDQHPAALYALSARLLGEGRGQEAANWMYAAQLRYRFLLAATAPDPGSGEAALFSALAEQVGRPVNEYIAGDVDEWIAAIDWALDWDERTDNAVTSKTEHAQLWSEVRAGLLELRDMIDAERETIARQRLENGLENR